jgi:hypothetical protein
LSADPKNVCPAIMTPVRPPAASTSGLLLSAFPAACAPGAIFWAPAFMDGASFAATDRSDENMAAVRARKARRGAVLSNYVDDDVRKPRLHRLGSPQLGTSPPKAPRA